MLYFTVLYRLLRGVILINHCSIFVAHPFSHSVSAMAELVEEGPEPSVDLTGLWQAISNDPELRQHVLAQGTLFKWPTPAQTGVINFDTLRPNAPLLVILIDLWCSRCGVMKTIFAPHARAEA